MGNLTNNIRFWMLVATSSLATSLYVIQSLRYEGLQKSIELAQGYGLLAVTCLYFALLASPITRFFKFLPYRGQYLKARRAIGWSAFLFASLHFKFAFFDELGGLTGVLSSGVQTWMPVSFGAISLFILTLMASTSFDYMVDKLGFDGWKKLHRLVYLVAVLIFFHALLIGTHTSDWSRPYPWIFIGAFLFLFGLEIARLLIWLKNR